MRPVTEKDFDIVYDIYIDNSKAINLYKKLGFKIDGIKPKHLKRYPDLPADEIMMSKIF